MRELGMQNVLSINVGLNKYGCAKSLTLIFSACCSICEDADAFSDPGKYTVDSIAAIRLQ